MTDSDEEMSPLRETIITVAACAFVVAFIIGVIGIPAFINREANREAVSDYRTWKKECDARGGVEIEARGGKLFCVNDLMKP